jgi:XTP/dITP diphosphohydrolase
VRKLVLATRNRGKVREIASILKDLHLDILSSLDFPKIQPVIEDGRTFQENAIKKAETIGRSTGLLALADDSGLEIDALDGQPGICSSRFAGPEQDDEKNIEKVLKLMRRTPENRRQARFRCVIALASPNGRTATVEGTCEGVISTEPRGSAGFGYDPIFLVPEYGKTFAELGEEVKNRISHRAKALLAARKLLAQKLAT